MYAANGRHYLLPYARLRRYRKRHRHLDSQVLKRWAWQILQGLVYLHGHNPPIIHRVSGCGTYLVFLGPPPPPSAPLK